MVAARSLRTRDDREIPQCTDVAALTEMHREERRLQTFGVQYSGVVRGLYCEGRSVGNARSETDWESPGSCHTQAFRQKTRACRHVRVCLYMLMCTHICSQ